MYACVCTHVHTHTLGSSSSGVSPACYLLFPSGLPSRLPETLTVGWDARTGLVQDSSRFPLEWPAWDPRLWSWVLGLVKEMNESGWAPHNLHDSLCQQILILPPARSPSIWLRRRSLSKTAISSRRKPRAHSVTIMWISQSGWSLKSIQRAWTTGRFRYWLG